MIREARYKHLEDDSKISGIGSLFRGLDRKLWSVNLNFVGKESKSIHFSAAPILARRRVLNSTQQYEKNGKFFKFMVSDAQNWKTAKLSDCPAYRKSPKGTDLQQYCFVAEVSGKRVYIPQLELARVLFYHDPYMARLSLQHNVLSEDFHVDFAGEKPQIYVLGEAEYPLQYYNREDNRRFLAWVLMDPHARASFESISANLLTKSYQRGNYEHWDFQFFPPPLTGVEFSVTGWYDIDSKSFFVWEIGSLSNIPSSISGEIDFIHPRFEREIGGNPKRRDGARAEAPEQYELDDDEISDIDKATINLISHTVSISFKNPFITNRISGKMRISKGLTGESVKEVLDKSLSANEKDLTGNLPAGAWNNLDDQTEDAHLYLGKFESFLIMVDKLESQYSCKILNRETVKLPKVGGGKKHKLADTQNPRCLAIVELVHENNNITLLEIDTSDGAAKLSTMMLITGKTEWVMDNIDQIKLGVMKKSLGWPTDIFKRALAANSYNGIPHPKSKHPGSLLPEEIEPWALRFMNWIERQSG